MKLLQGLAQFAALALPVVTLAANIAADAEDILGPASPLNETGRYIVQFSSSGSAKFRKRDGSRETDAFFSALKKRDIAAKVALSFTSDLFHGASFDLADSTAQQIDEIKSLPEVKNVWPVSIFTVPTPVEASLSSDTYSRWNPHNDTNVGLAHSRGYLGKDVIVAVVDTGVDYMHPALGGGIGEGFKVESGYDLVGDTWEPGSEYAPDNDPQDCNGHGTHVSGIIASGSDIVPGVAPSATLRMYKVFGCSGSTYEDVIIAAFLKAHKEGADIISASLGSDRGFPDAPFAVVVSAIQAANTFVSIAAGNSGAMGSFYTSNGGNGVDATTVGSVQHDEFAGFVTTARSSSGETREIVYLNEALLQWKVNGTLDAAFFPDTRNNNACDWSQEGVVSSTSVLVEPRGDCVWQIHDSNLMGRADYVFFYNHEGAEWEIPNRAVYSDAQLKGFGLISYEDGDWLVSQNEQGHNITFDFVNDNAPVGVGIEGYANGRINDFTSRGPTLDSRMKPEISAPGGSIFSTFPLSSGGWSTQSGTSMATPYIAGVAALFFSSQGGRKSLGDDAALLAHKRIVASGNPIKHHDGTENKASVTQQGAGLVDALKVIEYDTFVNPVILNLNDTDHFSASHNIQVTNSGNNSVTYHLNHQPGITIHTKPQANPWVGLDPPYSTDPGSVATVELSTDELVVEPGEAKTFSVKFTEPSEIDINMLPVYGGAIEVIGSQGEVVRVTYMGIKGSIYGSDTWELERGVPVLLSGYGGYIEESHNYTFEEGGDVPQPYFNMLWSTREVSFDYVDRDWTEADWKYPAVPGEAKYYGSFMTVPQGLSGTIATFPIRNYPRNTGAVYATPSNKFANGEDIPAGEYRILCRVLRTFGDPGNLADWQMKLSPWFRITREKPPPSTTTTTTTSSTPTSEPTPTVRPCSETATPISVNVTIGEKEDNYKLYRYSDFLSVDLTAANDALQFELTDDGYLQTWSPTDVLTDLFLNVHSTDNSLVYVYKNSSTTGSFSKLVCGDQDGVLKCEAKSKNSLYVCDSGSGLIRFDAAVKDGCEAVTLKAEPREDPNCK